MTLPDGPALLQIALRWLHVLAGVAWIGLLYFFNLVNVPFMKEIDAPTKGKVITTLLPRALWWFRWSAAVTWIVGFVYFAYLLALYQISHAYLGAWLGLTLVAYALVFGALHPKAGMQKDGRILAVVIAVVTIAYMALVVVLTRQYAIVPGTSSHVLGIALGGGLGTWMLLNVWGIIWRNQKKIIGWNRAAAEGGAAVPAEAAGLARQAFLASRTNAWLSLPMLFFMVASSHLNFAPAGVIVGIE